MVNISFKAFFQIQQQQLSLIGLLFIPFGLVLSCHWAGNFSWTWQPCLNQFWCNQKSHNELNGIHLCIF